MKIAHLILISILFILVLFSITTYINFKQSEEVKRNTEFLSQSSLIIRQSNRFQRNILYMERVLKGFLLTGEHDFIQSYDAAVGDNNALLSELSLLIADTSEQQGYLNRIHSLYDQWVHDYADPLRKAKQQAMRSAGDSQAFRDLFQEQRIVREEETINQKLQAEFSRLNSQEYSNRDVRKAVLERSELRTRNISLFLTTLSVVAGLLIAVFLSYYISARISRMVKMADSIAQGNYMAIRIRDNLPVMASERLPLLQIFTNLIGNAVKHHDKPEGEVSVYYRDNGDHYEFFVEDNGPGIAKNYHDKIFLIFQTLQERDSFESTGVGLAIVKKILDERHEQIQVVSQPGRGSVFSFTWSK